MATHRKEVRAAETTSLSQSEVNFRHMRLCILDEPLNCQNAVATSVALCSWYWTNVNNAQCTVASDCTPWVVPEFSSRQLQSVSEAPTFEASSSVCEALKLERQEFKAAAKI